MTKRPADAARTTANTKVAALPLARDLRIARIGGIEILLDPSVAVIFALVVYSVGAVELPVWHGDWSTSLRWITALGIGLLFFASLVGHELAHAVVARAFGIRVPRILLFLFGGQAQISREPDSPSAEFWIAVAGPAFSIGLGMVCMLAAQSMVSQEVLELLLRDPPKALARLGVAPTILLWLGAVNITLALFNLVPGFPLDGGRVLRASVWWATGDRLRATRWAANAGRGFGLAMVVYGGWTLLVRHDASGLWLMLMGWFLKHLATTSGAQESLHAALEGVHVRDVMQPIAEVPTLQHDADAEDVLGLAGQTALVYSGGQLVGIVQATRALNWSHRADDTHMARDDHRR